MSVTVIYKLLSRTAYFINSPATQHLLCNALDLYSGRGKKGIRELFWLKFLVVFLRHSRQYLEVANNLLVSYSYILNIYHHLFISFDILTSAVEIESLNNPRMDINLLKYRQYNTLLEYFFSKYNPNFEVQLLYCNLF